MMYFSAFHFFNEQTIGLTFEEKVERGIIKILDDSYYADLNKAMALSHISGSYSRINTGEIIRTDLGLDVQKK